ncbi:ATP-binding protein [Leifsonia shinshuensis]|uniref:ATP-binding protein n=1 Tax=Leifsonia shinshuensis TaxID=150026 RepID=UPI0035E678FB
MTDLPADDGLLRRGQFRIELVQLLNWGSYDGLHRMPVGRGGIAILGPTGRGKSTVLDAMSAVIMPNPQEFNRAARDDSRQRSERTVYSYARGKTDEVRDAGSDTTTTHFLRPLGTAFPTGAAITWRTELGETITAARLAWIGPETSTQDEVTTATVYLLAHGEFPLGRLNELVQEPGSSSPLTRASLARLVHPERDLVTSSQPELRVRLCEELGIGGSDESQLKALTLLRRAQASKGVFSIDELFKSFVLTEPRALSRWETTLSSYREASALYDVFETTRRKLEVLADVPARAEQYAAAAEDATGKRRLLSPADGETDPRLRVWLAERIRDWVSGQVDDVRDRKREQETQRREAEAEERAAHRAHQDAQARLAAAGGDPSVALRREQELAERILAAQTRERATADALFARAGLPAPESAEHLAELQREAETRLAAVTADEEQQAHRYELAGRVDAAKKAIAAATAEKRSFEQRRSNVPADADERRRRIAEAVGLAPEELPYAGELFEVAPGRRDWSRAVEAVLGEVATHLVVDERSFAAVRRYVNDADLRGRVVLVPAAAGRAPALDPVDRTVPALLQFDDASPFHGWLHDELVADRSVLCVETPEELDAPRPAGVSGAVTRSGMRSAARGRVVKDDRRSASWIGLDNTPRIHELASRIAALQAELAEARAASDRAEAEHGDARRRSEALGGVRAIEWDGIEVASHAARVAELAEQLANVAVAHPEAALLQEEAERHDRERVDAAKRGAALQARVDELESQHAALIDIEDSIADALERNSPLTPEERLLLGTLPFAAPREAADVDHRYAEALAALRDQIDAHQQSVEHYEQLLVVTFERYRDLDPAAEIDASIESLPAVQAIHRMLVEDDLPRAKADWLVKAGASMGDSLRALLTQIEEDGHAIRRGVRPISNALRGIEFREGSTLDIDPRPVSNSDLTEFTRTLRKHTAGAAGADRRDAAAIERDFLDLRRDLSRLEERSRAGEAWRRRVLDAREHYQFRAIETRADGAQIVHEGVAGKSGGEGQELIAFVLGAALRYRLGDGTDAIPTYAPIVLDEGFVKADNEYTGRALAAFRGLGFQLIVGAPRDKVNAFEEHVESVAYVTGDPARPGLSRIYSLSIREALEGERLGLATA